jgi:hypothetical protein
MKNCVVNQRLQERINFLLEKLPNTGRAVFDSRFKALAAGHIG